MSENVQGCGFDLEFESHPDGAKVRKLLSVAHDDSVAMVTLHLEEGPVDGRTAEWSHYPTVFYAQTVDAWLVYVRRRSLARFIKAYVDGRIYDKPESESVPEGYYLFVGTQDSSPLDTVDENTAITWSDPIARLIAGE